MIRQSPPPSLDRFRMLVADRLGLSCDSTRSEALSEALERRSRAHSLEVTSYLDRLERLQAGAVELSDLGAELTVGETYFFRHTEQLQAFAEVALPESAAALGARRPVRILSAGCASGEEPYSLAILAVEQGFSGPRAPDILGLDLNPRAIARAERALYSEWALRETAADMRQRYFRKEGSAHALQTGRIPPVRFRRTNLVDHDALGAGPVDILFCRNVLMYFTRDQAARMLERFAATLSPGGYLFLGHAETMHGLSSEFDLLQAHGAFYYRKKAAPEAIPPSSSFGRRGQDSPTQGGPSSARPSAAGRDSTRKAGPAGESSQRSRTASATDERKARSSELSAPRGASSPAALALAAIASSIEAERFDQALEIAVRMEPADVDPEYLVLRAALLTHSGRLEPAEQMCLLTLARDERSAPAHYLLALLRERQGNPLVAVEHDQIAAELDRTFAMPQLHLGTLLAAGLEVDRARTAFREAIRLLEREDPLRLLLFGGGFQRAGLIRLCQKELLRLGGAP